ncbi:hypothetical protein AVEN_112596-1, partial [Araneus ventricosus]
MSQVFPPGIITCNDYEVPESIKERVVGPIKVHPTKYWDSHPVNVNEETIYIGCVLGNLLPAEPEVHRHISLQVSKWWQKEWSNNCSCLQSDEEAPARAEGEDAPPKNQEAPAKGA